jgi:hypothetical protein
MNNQTNQDLEHLKILSICHYVLAGLCVFPMLYGLFYIVMGVFFGAAMSSIPQRPGEPPAALFGGIFIFIGLMISVIALVVGILLFKAGRNLSSRTGYMFCFVMACISCVFMPFGTILGIFTIIVLLRDSVKALFNGQNFGQFGNTPPNWQ